MKSLAEKFSKSEVELKPVNTFLAILRTGSLARAARELVCAQSTVTLHLQTLEATVGTKLLERRGRRVELTEAGRVFAERAEAISRAVADLSEAMRELHVGSAGTVTMGAIEPSASLRVPVVLARFCETRPHASIKLLTGGSGWIIESVESERLDFGIGSLPTASRRVQFEPLFREPLGMLVPTGSPPEGRLPIGRGQLAGRLIVTEEGCAYRAVVEDYLTGQGIRPSQLVEIATLRGIVGAVQEGMGVAILPIAAVDPAPEGTAVHMLDPNMGLTVGLVTPLNSGGNFGRPIVQSMVRAMRLGLTRSPIRPAA
jgi:DNA-binding transcriptional LysR family regulator